MNPWIVIGGIVGLIGLAINIATHFYFLGKMAQRIDDTEKEIGKVETRCDESQARSATDLREDINKQAERLAKLNGIIQRFEAIKEELQRISNNSHRLAEEVRENRRDAEAKYLTKSESELIEREKASVMSDLRSLINRNADEVLRLKAN